MKIFPLKMKCDRITIQLIFKDLARLIGQLAFAVVEFILSGKSFDLKSIGEWIFCDCQN